MPDLRKRKFKLLRKRIPKPPLPEGLQVAYYAELKAMIRFAKELIRERLLSRLPELLGRAESARGDSLHLDAQAPGRRVNKLMDSISAAFYKKFTHERLERLAEKVANAVSDTQRKQLVSQLQRAIGVPLESVGDKRLGARIKQFTADNVGLIKNVPQQMFDEVEKKVLQGMSLGKRHSEILADVSERFGVAESRVKLIARDQVLKFNGALNAARQQQLGIERYVWRTAGDERVRGTPGGENPKGTHYDRDGETYSWDDPPGDPTDPADGGHPGQAINCRCWAEPLLADLTAEE